VLRDGQYTGTGEAADLDNEKLIKMMVRREIKEIFPKQPAPLGEWSLEVKGLSRGNAFPRHQLQPASG
jgi:ABC-type sugar transport system ATPase subunit